MTVYTKFFTPSFFTLEMNCNYSESIIIFIIIAVMLVFFLVMPAMATIIVVLMIILIRIFPAALAAGFSVAAYRRTGCAADGSTDNGTIATADHFSADGGTGTTTDCAAQRVISQVSIRSAGRDQQQSQ